MKKNLGTIERVLRVALGGALAIWALSALLFAGDDLIWQLVNVALIALGVDFVVTGIRGYCPLYNRLGWSTVQPSTHA
jgi:small neutral amino acid transporter SnatA (MarC family)